MRIVGVGPANEAAVSAANNLAVEVKIALPAGANTIGAVTLPSTYVAAGNLVQLDYDTGAGTQNMPLFGIALPASGGSVAGGTSTNPLRTDPTGTTTQPVSGTVTANAGTGTFTTTLPAAAALADATANPTVPGVGAFNMGYNGSTWDRIRTANTGRLQVDVITGGGVDTPTNPVATLATTAALAAGASANVDVTGAGFKAKRLWQADVTASVPWKAIIQTLANGVATSLTTLFGESNQVVSWKPPHRSWAISGNTAGTDGFRVAFVNMDTSEAADMYWTAFSADT